MLNMNDCACDWPADMKKNQLLNIYNRAKRHQPNVSSGWNPFSSLRCNSSNAWKISDYVNDVVRKLDPLHFSDDPWEVARKKCTELKNRNLPCTSWKYVNKVLRENEGFKSRIYSADGISEDLRSDIERILREAIVQKTNAAYDFTRAQELLRNTYNSFLQNTDTPHRVDSLNETVVSVLNLQNHSSDIVVAPMPMTQLVILPDAASVPQTDIAPLQENSEDYTDSSFLTFSNESVDTLTVYDPTISTIDQVQDAIDNFTYALVNHRQTQENMLNIESLMNVLNTLPPAKSRTSESISTPLSNESDPSHQILSPALPSGENLSPALPSGEIVTRIYEFSSDKRLIDQLVKDASSLCIRTPNMNKIHQDIESFLYNDPTIDKNASFEDWNPTLIACYKGQIPVGMLLFFQTIPNYHLQDLRVYMEHALGVSKTETNKVLNTILIKKGESITETRDVTENWSRLEKHFPMNITFIQTLCKHPGVSLNRHMIGKAQEISGTDFTLAYAITRESVSYFSKFISTGLSTISFVPQTFEQAKTHKAPRVAFIGTMLFPTIVQLDLASLDALEKKEMEMNILGTISPSHLDCESEQTKRSCFGNEFCFLNSTSTISLERVYDATVYCMKVGHRKIGFVNVEVNAPTAAMSAVCIIDEFRSSGFGRFMLRQLFDILQRQGVHSVNFTILQDDLADSRLRFYKKLGYNLRETNEMQKYKSYEITI